MGLGSSLKRLDDAVLPSRWRNPNPDPVRQAANWVYLGGFFLVIGAVPAAVYGYWQALIVGIVNTIYGAVRLSAALRDQAAAAK